VGTITGGSICIPPIKTNPEDNQPAITG
jgi:hypothetical protein